MEYIDTAVVRALMSLRGISQDTLCTLAHVSHQDMHAWLNDEGDKADERVEFATQLEILRILGIAGESPRPDVVHFWRVQETFFSRASSTYWPLETVLKAFGRAQVSYLARETDPAITFEARTCFALKFGGFHAILEVVTHPLRSPSFDPESMANLSWLPDSMGVLLPDSQYDNLQPGSMKVKGLAQHLTYTSERVQWERLREMALEKGIPAEQVAAALLLPGTAPATVAASTPQVQQVPVTPAQDTAAAAASRLRAEMAEIQRPATPVAPVPSPQAISEELQLFARPAKTQLRAVN
jgi:hypothetical protein